MSSFSRFLRRAFSTTGQLQTDAAGSSVKSLSGDLYKERSLKRLVEKFKKSSELDRFRTKIGIYENTVRRLASAKRFGMIEEILEDQKKYKDITKEGFATRLIGLYGRSGMFDNAQQTFDEMPEKNCKRTVLSFNALLGACVNSKKFDKVDGLFRELPGKLSIEPDLVSYNTVIKAYCEMGSFDSAIQMLDEMEKKNVQPDLITFNTLLNGFYVNGRFADGEKIWGRMMEKNVVPDIRSYNAVLFGLGMDKRTKEAVELLGEMKTKGVKPDAYSFNALIRGFVKEDNLEESKRYYSEIEKNDCAPDKATFATLIPFLCKEGDLGFAVKLCKEIFSRRCLVDGAILQLVVDRLVKESKIPEAKELVQLSKSNDFYRYKLIIRESSE